MNVSENRTDKNPHAQALGRLGGLARRRTMSAKERSNRAREAALARWNKQQN